MMSNSVSAQNFLTLWTLNPGVASSCSAVWIHAICACFRRHNINHHSNQQQPPLPLLIWDMRCSIAVSLSVFRACNDVCVSLSDSFKCFHTADVFPALVLASIWLCNVIGWYKLFGLFAYSAEHRKRFISYFRTNNFGCRTFGASL